MSDLISDIESCKDVTPPSYDEFGKELEASEKFWAETRRRNEQIKQIMERRSGVDWFDSCRPDDRD